MVRPENHKKINYIPIQNKENSQGLLDLQEIFIKFDKIFIPKHGQSHSLQENFKKNFSFFCCFCPKKQEIPQNLVINSENIMILAENFQIKQLHNMKEIR